MKFLGLLCLLTLPLLAAGQNRVNPVIKNYGGIFEIPYADEKPDPNMEYHILVEVSRASERPDSLNWALNNVARMLNLHAMGGVPKDKMHVVLAIHAGAGFTIMDNATYKAKYGVDNPNLDLLKELDAAGVKLVVCGQSLIARQIDRTKLAEHVHIATSMLTTMTTYQLKGYAVLNF